MESPSGVNVEVPVVRTNTWCFHDIDNDNDGIITQKEFFEFWIEKGLLSNEVSWEDGWRVILTMSDENSDGKLTKAEFYTCLRKLKNENHLGKHVLHDVLFWGGILMVIGMLYDVVTEISRGFDGVFPSLVELLNAILVVTLIFKHMAGKKRKWDAIYECLMIHQPAKQKH